MRSADVLKFAVGSVASHRLRSGLTMLGIAVGIGAVVLLTAVGEGVRQFVLGEFTQFGTNIIAVTPGKKSTFGISGAAISSVRPLSADDAAALYRLSSVAAVVPVIQGNARVEFSHNDHWCWRGHASCMANEGCARAVSAQRSIRPSPCVRCIRIENA